MHAIGGTNDIMLIEPGMSLSQHLNVMSPSQVLSPPDDPVQKKVIRCGIHVVTVVGDGSGRAWATGTNLGKLRWPAAQWESHGAVVRGRAHAEATGSWEDRICEAAECTQDDRVTATKRLAEPDKKTAKKNAMVDANQKTINGFFKK